MKPKTVPLSPSLPVPGDRLLRRSALAAFRGLRAAGTRARAVAGSVHARRAGRARCLAGICPPKRLTEEDHAVDPDSRSSLVLS